MKIAKLWIKDTVKGEKYHTKSKECNFNVTTEDKYFHTREKDVIQIQEAYRTLNKQHQKRNSLCYIIAKTLKTKNKKGGTECCKMKGQITQKEFTYYPDYLPGTVKATNV